GLSNMWGRSLSHEKPYAYLASDAFLHFSVSEYSLAEGRFKYAPPYDVGGHKMALESHPPFLHSMTIMIAKASGLKTHDAIYLTTLIVILAGILALYAINRSYNKDIAILALPLGLFIFSKLFNMMLLWGIWHFPAGVGIMMGAAYFIPRINEKGVFIFFGIIYGALVITHIPEAIFLGGFIAFYLIIEIARRKEILWSKIRRFIYGGVLGSLLVIYYIFVFRASFLISEGFRGTASDGYFGFPNIFITHLGVIGLVFLIGFCISMLNRKRFSYPILFSIFFFCVSYLTYLGFGKRAFTHRFFWHIYLGIFFGIAVLYIVKLAVRKWNTAYTFIIFMVILCLVAYPLNATTKIGQGIMDDYNWRGLMWLRDNVENDVPVFYFYSDALSNAAALYSSHHVSFKIGNKNITKSIESGMLYERYKFGLADSLSVLACELGFLKIGHYRDAYMPNSPDYKCEEEYKKLNRAPNNFWICDLEYTYFNKFSSNQVLADYSIEVAKMLLRAPWIKKAYENELVVILHNERPGDECIEINTEG
ncbi:hypothetical protein KY358_03960, partial [Candidatus Woesearchaeota archaeon]|nr:hypothetical protein [Candidatus Woesearchaeota archaeon]